ncbi:HAD family hydrolase [Allorhizocola rhizosphaerae]|uniref:HAD family hydrolase n=1 Tax=Allorhizocola rhizosphaerae TaxID=1872709 RepID=UPI0013C2B175|nr:HAD hydrolase-like protein [Allorhizocola rhizosphaerae]
MVVFELGNVLIGWQPQLLYQKYVPDPQLRAWFSAEVCRAPWEDKPVRDNALEEGLRRLADRHPRRAKVLAAHHDHLLQAMIHNKVPLMAGTLHRLRDEGVRLLGITDLPSKALTQVMRIHPDALDQLADIVVAEEIGMRPSDPELFEYALRRFEMRANQCLYVDSPPANIQAAESVGIASVKYESIGALRPQLRERGYLPPLPWTERMLR